MYHIKEILLKNGDMKQRRLAIYFDDPNLAIVAEFLMADAPLLNASIINEMDEVLEGKIDETMSSGNRCKLEISPKKTIISDLFAGLEDVDAYLPCEIDTRKLRSLIVMWVDELEAFRRNQ